MASAQLMKVTNTIDNRVEGIADNVLVVDNRVVCIDDRVAGVDERVTGVDVNDKLVTVIDGAQCIFNQSSKIFQSLTRLDGKEARGVIQQTADDVDELKRSWFSNRIHAGHTDLIIPIGNQLRQNLRRWLSPPDPSTNHNIACNAHPSQGNGDLVFRRKYLYGMEVNRSRVATLDPWETCGPASFFRPMPPDNDPYL